MAARDAVSLRTHGIPAALLRDDPEGVLGALVDVSDAHLRDRYDDATALRSVRNPLTCEARWLPEIGRDVGWVLDTTLPEALQRKILASIVPLYRQKGTAPGMVDAVRLFLGVEARVRAPWGDGWRLGRAHLGGVEARYTATGGETSINVAAIDTRWTATAHMHALRVWRNDVELDRWRFYETGRAEVALLTEGYRYTATGGETALDLPWAYYGRHDALRVEKNGLRIDQPSGWAELTGGSLYYSRITLASSLTRGDVVTVWHLENRTALTAGDEITLRTTESRATRLAPEEGTDATVILPVELPRALTTDEARALDVILDVMKPGFAQVSVRATSTSPVRWRLGTSVLSRGTGLSP
jgi:phage tail-like protein